MNPTITKARRQFDRLFRRFRCQTAPALLTWIAIPLLLSTLVFAPWEIRHAALPSVTAGVRYAPLWKPPAVELPIGVRLAYGILLIEWAALGITFSAVFFLVRNGTRKTVSIPELRDWQEGHRRPSELVFEWAEGESLVVSVVRPYRRVYLIKRDSRSGQVSVLLPSGEFAVLKVE